MHFLLTFFIGIFLFTNTAMADNTCTGATYYDSDNDICIACPDQYDYDETPGKTSINQCQIHCPAGEYAINVPTYSRLEYIANNSDGKQWINTGIPRELQDYRLVMGVMFSNTSTRQIIGAQGYFYFGVVNNKFQINASNQGTVNYAAATNTKYTIDATFHVDTITRDYRITRGDGTLIANVTGQAATVYSQDPITANFSVFSLNNGLTPMLGGKTYFYKLYDKDGILLRDMIPVRRNSDGVLGMYDMVTETFFTNSGSGSFTAGPVIEPSVSMCSPVGIGYWSAGETVNYASAGTHNACTNAPANASYTDFGTANDCPWECDAGYGLDNGVCRVCTADEFSINGVCEHKLNVTTTSDATSLQFSMTPIGTFYVDCGDGGTLSQVTKTTYSAVFGNRITRTKTDVVTYKCTWNTAGAHTIKFAGTPKSYNTSATVSAISFNVGSTQTKVASVSGSLGLLFPQLGTSNGQFPRFYQAFRGATNLTHISGTLFSGLTGGANMTYMFNQTFYGCTGLQSIPGGLFNSITTGANYMFSQTFYGCTGLQSIPAGLFSGIRTAAGYMFQQTFSGCSNLGGYIPPTTFAGLIANNSQTANYMWQNTFANTQLVTSCSSLGMEQYITGYEGTDTSTYKKWNGYVSCHDCPGGQYYNGTSCVACTNSKPAHSTFEASLTAICPWTCNPGFTEDNGTCVCNGANYINSNTDTCDICPDGYDYNTTPGKTSINQCQTQCSAGTYATNTEYTPLEYIANSGTQWIDTGVIRQLENYRLVVGVEFNETTSRQLIGTQGFFYVGVVNGEFQITGANAKVTGYPASANTKYIIDTTFKADANKVSYNITDGNGNTIANVNNSEDIGSDNINETAYYYRYAAEPADATFSVFSLNDGLLPMLGGKTYFYKLYDANGDLLRDMIPVRRNSDNVLGMYDRVTGTFFTNSGTGTFTAGPVDANTTVYGCFDVGLGYYSLAQTLNYGQSGTRTACDNKPENSSYTASGTSAQCPWACDTGYEEDNGFCRVPDAGATYNGVYHPMCSFGKELHVGNIVYPAFADKTNVPSPVLHIKSENTICYVYFEQDTGNGDPSPALRIRWTDGNVYHAIDPR